MLINDTGGPAVAPATRPLRVLQVSARYYPAMGGIETHVYEVARRMAALGVQITVATTDVSGELPAEETLNGVTIRRVPAWPARRDYYWAPGLYPIITRGGWDVIHCQGYHTLVAPLAMLAALRAGIPYVVTFHSGGHSSTLRHAARDAQRALLRPLLRRAAQLIAVSEFEAQLFRPQLHVSAEQLVVVPNGSSIPKVAEVARDPEHPLILSVGRLERYKGHHRVIEAFPHLLARYPGAQLRIAGAGSYEQALRQMVAELKLEERVTIAAVPPNDREQMAKLLAGAALVVLLSEYEAHPIAAMETLAIGRPMLVTQMAGLKELVDRGLVRGIPLESSPAETAAAMIAQLEEPLVPADLQLPSWETCVSDLLTIYRNVRRRTDDPALRERGAVYEPANH